MFYRVSDKDGIINMNDVYRIAYNNYLHGLQFFTKHGIYTRKCSEEEADGIIETLLSKIG